MKKVNTILDKLSKEQDKKIFTAIIIAIFGIILFIALALTLPLDGN